MREGPDGGAEPGLFDQLHQRDRPQHPGQGGEAQVRAGRQTRQGRMTQDMRRYLFREY